jgi:hypothetical protein
MAVVPAITRIGGIKRLDDASLVPVNPNPRGLIATESLYHGISGKGIEKIPDDMPACRLDPSATNRIAFRSRSVAIQNGKADMPGFPAPSRVGNLEKVTITKDDILAINRVDILQRGFKDCAGDMFDYHCILR